jgi:hypothetical protein
MADLKAAAERLRKLAEKREQSAFPELRVATQQNILQEASDCLLAAQALEALAWLKDKDAILQAAWWGDRSDWMVCFDDDEYAADTPLGALLAAMEGENDGN